VDILRGTPGVEKVDTRLLNLTIAEGIVKTQLVEGQIVFPTYLGSSQILVIGIDPNQTIGDWHTSDGFLSTSDPHNVMVVGFIDRRNRTTTTERFTNRRLRN